MVFLWHIPREIFRSISVSIPPYYLSKVRTNLNHDHGEELLFERGEHQTPGMTTILYSQGVSISL